MSSNLTIDLQKILNDLAKRVYTVEQIATSPSVMGTGGMEQTNEFPDGIFVGGVEISLTPPDPVTGLTVTTGTFYDAIYADVSWTAPAGGVRAIIYDVELSEEVAGSPGTFLLRKYESTAGTNFRFENLRPSWKYRVRVVGRNTLGVGSNWTAAAEFTTGVDVTIPGAPGGVLLARGATSVMVKWNESASVDVLGGEGLYEVEIDTTTAFNTVALQSVKTSSTIVTFTNLSTTQATYYARVRSIDSSGNASPWSANSSIFAGGVTETMIVGDFSAAKITYGTMSGDRLSANTADINVLKTSTLTSKNITIGSGGQLIIGSPPNDGIYINSAGITAYSGSTQTFRITSSGTATFTGSITGSSVSSTSISGSELVGSVIKTAATGRRIEIGITNQFPGFNGMTSSTILLVNGSEAYPGRIETGPSTNEVRITSGGTSSSEISTIRIWPDTIMLYPGGSSPHIELGGTVSSGDTYSNSVTGRDVYITSGGIFGYLASTRETKKHIKKVPQQHSLDLGARILSLDLMSFIYKNDENESPQVGFIAEDAEEVLGEDAQTFLYYSDEGKLEGINYQKVLLALVPMMKHMAQKLELVA